MQLVELRQPITLACVQNCMVIIFWIAIRRRIATRIVIDCDGLLKRIQTDHNQKRIEIEGRLDNRIEKISNTILNVP